MADDNVVTMAEVQDILSAPEPDPILNVLQTDEERLVAAKILPALTAKVDSVVRLENAKKFTDEVTSLKAANEKAIRETIDQIKRDAKPLEPADVEKLLSQDYLTIPVSVPKREKGKTKQIEFVLGEVPQAVEQRFLKVLKDKLMPYLKTLTAIDFKNSTEMASKIQTAIEIVPEALEIMAELVSIALNPYKESEYDFVTTEWVKNNLSSYRQFNIIMGQVSVSRIRDFFSAAYQGFPA